MEIIGLISFVGAPVSLIGFLVQLIRKKPNKKKWGIALVVFVALFIVCLALTPPSTPPKELTNIGEYNGSTIELLDANVIMNEQGRFLKVDAIYTNNNFDPLYASSAFAVRAFQNDTELDDWSYSQEDSGNMSREVKNGASVNVSFLFLLSNNSEVEVLIGTPTADMETIGKAIYLEENKYS